MILSKSKWKWVCTAAVIVLMTVGGSWADGGRDDRHKGHGHGHHYAPSGPHGHHYRIPPPPPPVYRHRPHHHPHGGAYVYTYAPPPPPRVYVPAYPVYPAPSPFYGGSLFSASIGAPGISFGLSIGGWQ